MNVYILNAIPPQYLFAAPAQFQWTKFAPLTLTTTIPSATSVHFQYGIFEPLTLYNLKLISYLGTAIMRKNSSFMGSPLL